MRGCGYEKVTDWLIQLSSAMFGISGFRWCHKNRTLSKAGMIVSSVAQQIPCADVIGSILCYIMFQKAGKLANNAIKRQYPRPFLAGDELF